MFAVIIFLLTLSLVSSSGLECGGPLSSVPFTDLYAATQYFCTCNFPTYKLTVSCILSSCLALTGVCPLTSNKTVNAAALNHTVSILNTCLGQKGLTCGLNMSSVLLVAMGVSIAQLVPVNVATGSCVQTSGDINVFSGAKFTVSQINGLNISLVIEATLTSVAIYNCTFHVCPNSFLNLLLGSTPSNNSLNTPGMTGSYSLNVSAVVSANPSMTTPTMVILTDQSIINGNYTNFVNCAGDALSPKIVTLINQKMSAILKNSTAISVAINFLSTYAALGLLAAQLNCP